MKKKIVLACVFLLLLSGCAILDAFKSAKLTTDESGQIVIDQNSVVDPNGVAAEVETISAVGKTTETVGLVTGNPAVAGVGVLILLAGSILGKVLLGKK
jgi:hypothetical protein